MFDNFIIKDGPYELIESFKDNGRVLIMWYDESSNLISGAIFSDNPKRALSNKEFAWGYVTRYIPEIKTREEAERTLSLYIQDIRNKNFWWENDQ